MAEKLELELISSKLPNGLSCPKCKGGLSRVEAAADYSNDDYVFRTTVELRCPGCHATIAEVEFNGPAVDGTDDYD